MPMDEEDQGRFERIGEPSLETPQSEQAAERRVSQRHEYRGAVVWMMGSYPTSGVTLDTSLHGVKVSLKTPLSDAAKGLRCGVGFLDAVEGSRPHYAVGTVRRVEATKEGCFVGIEFDSPLEALELSA